MEREIVFEVLREGGSISIERAENPEIGFDYFLKTQEAEIFEDETPVNQTNVFDNFYEPFDKINQKYAWYNLHLNYIDEDFSEYATEELVKVLNQKQIETLKNQELLEEKLHCFLNCNEIPEKNGLKRMRISTLVKVTEHEFIERYFEDDQEPDKKYQLKGTYEMWTEEQPYYLKNTELQNENLKNYLHQRGLSASIYSLLKEVHFTIGEKNLYAIGFENLSGGWELRNIFYKGSLLKKDISVINLYNESQSQNQNEIGKKIAVFEGFMDALSFVEMKPFFKGDVLVMNSISLLNKAKEYLKHYSEIHLFLDNDKAGENCKNEILKSFPEAKNHSEIYALHKDLNDYLKSKQENKNSIEISSSILITEEEEIKQPHQIYQRKR